MNYIGQWREGGQGFRQNHRPGTRTAAAVGRGECFVQIDVHTVDAQVARPDAPDDGVEVRSVAIEITARFVDGVGDGDDIGFKQSAGVGIGEHDAGNVVAKFGFHRVQVHAASVVRRNGVHREAAGRRRGRIGAMGRFGNQNPGAALDLATSPIVDRGLDAHHAAKLPMGARGGGHGDGRHAGKNLQPMRHLIDQRERALNG